MPKKITAINYQYPTQITIVLCLDDAHLSDPTWSITINFAAIVPSGMTPSEYVTWLGQQLSTIGAVELKARQNVLALQPQVGVIIP